MMKRDCLTCVHKSKRHTEDPCFDCMPIEPYYFGWEPDKPQTNADHIRGMTDEKLAELFAGMCQSNADGESRCYACLFNAWCPACGYTDDWLDWLQQPYKENEDER